MIQPNPKAQISRVNDSSKGWKVVMPKSRGESVLPMKSNETIHINDLESYLCLKLIAKQMKESI